MKKILLITLLVVGLIIGGMTGFLFWMTRGLEEGENLEISLIDLSLVEDGVYTGRHVAGRWTTEIKVTVENHVIVHLELIEDVTFSKEHSFRFIADGVMEAQSLDVDVEAGGTVTGKAYLKAIENALKQGIPAA